MYSAHDIVDGFPGKSTSHGAFGWSSVWLLLRDDRVVLVETGSPAYIPLLSARLARLRLSVNEVTDILLTHAHWDHLSNIMMFPNAQVWIGAEELAWARTLPTDEPFISSLHIDELHRRGDDVNLIVGGVEIMPGISTIATPGHTPGHLAYAVETDSAPLLFAGDSVKNLYELATLQVDSTLDLPASIDSIRRLRAHMQSTGARLVPGHDTLLHLEGDSVRRTAPQRAQISFFAGSEGEEDRSIDDFAQGTAALIPPPA